MGNGESKRAKTEGMEGSPPCKASGYVAGWNNELFDAVFGNTLLAEIIFRYALRYKKQESDILKRWSWNMPGYPEIHREDVCNFRLVCKSMKQAVSDYLQKNKEPLYMVTMTKNNSLKEAPEVDKNGKISDTFLHFLNTRTSQFLYAGFCLKMEAETFRLENYDHLLGFLEQCGQHLVEMQLEIPKYGGSFPGQFPNTLKFPQWRKLKMRSGDELKNILTKKEKLANPKANMILLIQSLLQLSSSTLKHLHIEIKDLPSEFQYVKLPYSLVSFRLLNSRNRKLLECLTRNRLPELKELSLFFDEENLYPRWKLLFKVFNNLRHGLRVLNIMETNCVNECVLQFPVMESLEHLKIAVMGNIFDLETAEPSLTLTDVFPKLTHVHLPKTVDEQVQQFSSTVASVTTLKLSPVEFDSPIPLDIIKASHLAFPNLTDLSMELADNDGYNFADVKYAFREMRQLKRLSIKLDMCEDDGITSDHVDSLLIGARLEFVQGLKVGPRECWKHLKMDIQTEHSIKMLKDLTYLRLTHRRCVWENEPLISELAFLYALNGMKKLEHVRLERGFSLFQAPKEIAESWKLEGRKIVSDPV